MAADRNRETRVRRRARRLGAWVFKDRGMTKYDACWFMGHELTGSGPHGRHADLGEVEAFLERVEKLTTAA